MNEKNNKMNIISFPDKDMCDLQIQAVKDHRNMILKYKTKVNEI